MKTRTAIDLRNRAWKERQPGESISQAVARLADQLPKESPSFKGRHISSVASEIRQPGESWQNAMQRASILQGK